ncbi:protein of unknown function [Methylocella tundrae]|uniref:Uncharacterized protein n=1 Tax=Methylocella tundrae TaxID=227605 RepID=A0A4U8YWW6_METTU|nr:protein of unknown function [Methylocella tundrae]
MSLVENEPTKLTAAWLIAVSNGAMAVGVIYVEESGEGQGIRLRKAELDKGKLGSQGWRRHPSAPAGDPLLTRHSE